MDHIYLQEEHLGKATNGKKYVSMTNVWGRLLAEEIASCSAQHKRILAIWPE